MTRKNKLDLDFFETVLVYNALTDRFYLSSIAQHLKPSFFKNKHFQPIINIITTFFQKRGIPPTLTEIKSYLTTKELKNSFKNVVSHFNKLDKTFNKDELFENTERFLKERAVYTTMLEVAEQLDDDIDSTDVLKKFETACNISLHQNLGHDYFNDIDKHIQDLKTIDFYIKSGWNWLDNILGGGFLQNGKALYVFAGQTNIGKSIVLSNIAANICDSGKSVLLLTFEMPELIYSKRISSRYTNIPYNQLTSNIDVLENFIKNRKIKKHPGQLLIKEFPPNTVTPNQLKSYIEQIINKGISIDAIVLDYINLLQSPQNYSGTYEKIKDICEQVRALTYTFNCPIITATQLNRTGYNITNPEMDTIGESIGLASTGDAIISLYQEDDDREQGILRLGMMKNRFGPNFGNHILTIDYPTLSLKDDNVSTLDTDTSNNPVNNVLDLLNG